MRFVLTLAFAAVSTVAFAQEAVDYTTAYHQAAENNRPLLVLVTAEWCPPCQVMKSTTIPELVAKNAFSGVNYATVDYDSQVALASQLIGERGLPQLLLFQKVEGQWQRRYLAGLQSVAGIETFMQQAGVVTRVAEASDSKVDSATTKK